MTQKEIKVSLFAKKADFYARIMQLHQVQAFDFFVSSQTDYTAYILTHLSRQIPSVPFSSQINRNHPTNISDLSGVLPM